MTGWQVSTAASVRTLFVMAHEWRKFASGDRCQGAQPGPDKSVRLTQRERSERGYVWQGYRQWRDPVEVYNCLGEFEMETLCKLFNIIIISECMQSAWRNSTLVSIFKGNVTFKSMIISAASNCSHTFKIYEKGVDRFMPGRCSTCAIFTHKQTKEKQLKGHMDTGITLMY